MSKEVEDKLEELLKLIDSLGEEELLRLINKSQINFGSNQFAKIEKYLIGEEE